MQYDSMNLTGKAENYTYILYSNNPKYHPITTYQVSKNFKCISMVKF